jgi:hypothetical protein
MQFALQGRTRASGNPSVLPMTGRSSVPISPLYGDVKQNPPKWSALENDAQCISDEPKWRCDYRSGRMRRGSDDAVWLIGGGSCRSGSLRRRITRLAGGGVRSLATGIRTALEHRAYAEDRGQRYRRKRRLSRDDFHLGPPVLKSKGCAKTAGRKGRNRMSRVM